MNALCKDGSMRLSEWISLAAGLDIDGVEWYAGFLEMQDEDNWLPFRRQVEDHGMVVPMMCCSPDFTHPDPAFRKAQVDRQKRWIDMTAALGGSYCRVLSGQKRPALSIAQGTVGLPSSWRITIRTIFGNIPSLPSRWMFSACW